MGPEVQLTLVLGIIGVIACVAVWLVGLGEDKAGKKNAKQKVKALADAAKRSGKWIAGGGLAGVFRRSRLPDDPPDSD
jgi:hypothetical protein